MGAVLYLSTMLYQGVKPLPPGTHVDGLWHTVAADQVEFLADLTFQDRNGQSVSEQVIFDRAFELIDRAETYLVLDFFLVNDFAGDPGAAYRSLSGELIDRLVARKQRSPGLPILMVSDALNNVYGSELHAGFERLRLAGIDLVLTDHSRMRDSNPLYSTFYRLGPGALGNDRGGGFLPNPFLPGDEVTLRSYLALLNFKANHRKVMVAGLENAPPLALVTSANPHDGSSRHSNVAFLYQSEAALDQLDSELSVATFSGWPNEAEWRRNASLDSTRSANAVETFPKFSDRDTVALRVATEGAARDGILDALDAAQEGDQIDMAMFYLSHREIIEALLAAADRGARVRMILDANRDAFGREKNGVPNRPVARELVEKSDGAIQVRWFDTHGEQFHTKMTVVRGAATTRVSLGSSNLTRRNIDDLNLEANLEVVMPASSPLDVTLSDYFDRLWQNQGGASYTLDYEAFADSSRLKTLQYRFMEATGLSTF